MTGCALCRGLGWILDGHPHRNPQTLELLPCPVPDCPVGATSLELLSVNVAEFLQVARDPEGLYVMSVSR